MSTPQISALRNSARKETILSTLKRVVNELTGIDEDAIDVNANFIETGVDSLMLIQAVQVMQDTLGVKLSAVQLMEELTSLDLVADYIDELLPREEVLATETIPNAPDPSTVAEKPQTPASPQMDTPASTVKTPVTPAMSMPENGNHDQEPEWSIPATGLDQIIAQQLQVMAQQLEMLRGSRATAVTPEIPRASKPVMSATTAVAAPTEVKLEPEGISVTAVKGITPELFNPYQPINPGSKGGLTPRQQQHLDSLIARHTERTKESKRVTQTYRPYLADSRASVGFKLRWKEMIYPIVGAGSRGSHLWDVDGNEYVDLTMGFGLHLLGHSPGFVIEAMEKQLKQGIELGPQIYLAGKVCQLISELTGVERVNICNSGTEAVMGALRVARTITRRNKIALFAGAYHGWSDGTQARPLTIGGKQRTVPNAPGVQPQAVEDVMVLNWNDPKSLDTLKEHAHELAAVLVEPVQSRRPDIQPREFLHELRRLTEQAGTALIFDEMITGFRIANGGAQAFFGIKADLLIYGKVLGAGLPLGIVAGKAAFMDAFDGGMWNYGDASYPTTEKTLFAGAYFKHPLTMATAWAILNHLKDNPDLLPQLNQKTTRLVNALNDYFQQCQLPIYVGQFGSIFRFLYPRDFKHMDLFFYHLLNNGVFLWEGRNCFLSAAHTDEDLEFIIEAIKKSVEQMREGGLFPDLTTPTPITQRTSAPAPSNNGRGNTPVEIIRQTDKLARTDRESSNLKTQQSSMQFSLYYFGNYESEFSSDKYDLLIQGARFGDRHGYSAIWVPERHFHSFGGFSPNPSVVAAAIARETEHISIRAGSVVLPLHNPIRVAEEWSVVDNLSQGRVGISFASGWNPNDFAFAPDSYERRREVMYEGIETVQKLWRGEMVQVRSGTGKEINVKLSPMPMQAVLPTWVTGATNGTFIKAGEIGANFLTNLSDQSIEELADKIALYRTARTKNGHDPQAGHVTVLLHTFVLDNAQQARQKAHDPFLRYLKSSLGLTIKGKVQMNVDQLSPEDLNYILESGFERHLKAGALIGTPEQCAPIVDRLIASGVNEIGCLIDFGIDTPSVLDSLQHLNVLRARYEKSDAGTAAENVQTIEVRSAGESIDESRQVPLTEAQKQLWLATQMGEDASRAYNESATMQLRGPLDVAAMQRALQKLVDRHEALRTTVSSDGVYQQYLPRLEIEIPVVDFSQVEPDKRETQVAAWTANEGNRLFDLVKGPLINFQIAKLDDQYHHLLFVYHHLVADGRSWAVLLDELLKVYAAERQGLSCELPVAVPFREFADRQAAILEGPSASQAESYWVEQFHDRVPVLELPTDQPRPIVPTFNGAQELLVTSPQLFDDLKRLKSQLGSTMFTLLLSAYDVLLHRLSGQKDLVMGVSSAGQSIVARDAVGYCVNMLPIRSRITGNPMFAGYLNSIKRLLFAGAENQNYSFGKLIEKLNLRVEAGRSPFFSATFNIDRAGVEVQFDNLKAEVDKNFTGSARFDLSFNLVETDKELILKCNYNSDLFHAQTIQGWLECYRTILESIAVNPEQRVLDLPLLPELDREQLLVE